MFNNVDMIFILYLHILAINYKPSMREQYKEFFQIGTSIFLSKMRYNLAEVLQQQKVDPFSSRWELLMFTYLVRQTYTGVKLSSQDVWEDVAKIEALRAKCIPKTASREGGCTKNINRYVSKCVIITGGEDIFTINKNCIKHIPTKKEELKKLVVESKNGISTKVFGPIAWFLIHYASFTDFTDEEKMKKFLMAFGKTLPCKSCRENFESNYNTLPSTQRPFSPRNFKRTVYNLHNIVNKQLNKQTKPPSFDEVVSLYSSIVSNEKKAWCKILDN